MKNRVLIISILALMCMEISLVQMPAKAAAKTFRPVHLQKGKGYNLKTILSQTDQWTMEGIAGNKKIKWTSQDKSIKVKNGKLRCNKTGEYKLKGRLKKKTYVIPIRVAAGSWEKVPDNIVQADISFQGKSKTIIDPVQVKELCKRINKPSYRFDYKYTNNPKSGDVYRISLVCADGSVRNISLGQNTIKEHVQGVKPEWWRSGLYSCKEDYGAFGYVKEIYESLV